MYWTEVKNALLYGQPPLPPKKLQPQAVQIAVREIARLTDCGWVEELTEEMLQRIQTACQTIQSAELWDEFHEKISSHLQQKKKKARKKRRKTSKAKASSKSKTSR